MSELFYSFKGYLKDQITCQGIPPNTSSSIPSTHSPTSSFFTCPNQSFEVRLFSNDTAGCNIENGAAIVKPNRMHSSCSASVHATEYNPPKTVYLKAHFEFLACNLVSQATFYIVTYIKHIERDLIFVNVILTWPPRARTRKR